MKKYMKPAIRVVEVEMLNCTVVNASNGVFSMTVENNPLQDNEEYDE